MTDTNKERAAFEAWYFAENDSRLFCESQWRAWKARAAKAPAAPTQVEPMFWVRLLRDGMYEGPVHHKSVGGKMMRDEKPDEWHPLYTAPPAPTEQWRDIETAPKDGSEILLGRAASEDLDCDAISVPGSWQEGYEDGVDYMGIDDGFVDSHYQIFSGGRSFGAESHRYAPNQPTHWMPLPTPPQGAANKDES